MGAPAPARRQQGALPQPRSGPDPRTQSCTWACTALEAQVQGPRPMPRPDMQGGAVDNGGSGGGGFLRAMIDTIIGNLQMKISNIHVRYEVSRPESARPTHASQRVLLRLAPGAAWGLGQTLCVDAGLCLHSV